MSQLGTNKVFYYLFTDVLWSVMIKVQKDTRKCDDDDEGRDKRGDRRVGSVYTRALGQV